MNDLSRLSHEVRAIKRLHPKSARGVVSNERIREAIGSEGESISAILPLIEAFADLRVRGFHRQAAFIVTFMGRCELRSGLNIAAEGAGLLEASCVYRSAYAMRLETIDIGELWSPAIAAETLDRLSLTAEPSVAKRALRQRAAITSSLH